MDDETVQTIQRLSRYNEDDYNLDLEAILKSLNRELGDKESVDMDGEDDEHPTRRKKQDKPSLIVMRDKLFERQ